jgi:hypothetical protein
MYQCLALIVDRKYLQRIRRLHPLSLKIPRLNYSNSNESLAQPMPILM